MSNCPMCGIPNVPQDEVRDIEADMEYDNKRCARCGRRFWEVREENEGDCDAD